MSISKLSMAILFDVMNGEMPYWSYPSKEQANLHAAAINELARELGNGVTYIVDGPFKSNQRRGYYPKDQDDFWITKAILREVDKS